jgi:hypothetical protein
MPWEAGMFGFARIIARNCVWVIALAGVGYFLFAGQKEAPKRTSPWSAGATTQVASNAGTKASMTDNVLKVADSAAKYAGVQDYTPSALKDQAVGNMNKTQGALAKVGSGQN